MKKYMTFKNLARIIILLLVVGASYAAGRLISILTHQRVFDNSYSSMILASWEINGWATAKALSYGIAGALLGIITGLCLMYCSSASLRYNKRNKQFLKYVIVFAIFQVIALVAGAVFADTVINIFDNSLLLWHITHLIPLLVIQILALSVFLLFPTKHLIRF